ncbi:MAG: hypothetical protein RLZZ86_1221, partial [Cyanobacteriota bacterium]
TWDLLVGMVVLLSIIFVNTPPNVSIPKDSGVTSKSSRLVSSPAKTPAWIAAPSATASSGLMERSRDLPLKNLINALCTAGIRVEPPTKITLSILSGLSSALLRAWRIGSIVPGTFEGLENWFYSTLN